MVSSPLNLLFSRLKEPQVSQSVFAGEVLYPQKDATVKAAVFQISMYLAIPPWRGTHQHWGSSCLTTILEQGAGKDADAQPTGGPLSTATIWLQTAEEFLVTTNSMAIFFFQVHKPKRNTNEN